MNRFRYNSVEMVSEPGDVFFIPPEVLHDGYAGGDEGYAYQTLFIRPDFFAEEDEPIQLPELGRPVQRGTRIARILSDILDSAESVQSACDAQTIQDLIRERLRPLAIAKNQARCDQIQHRKVLEVRDWLDARASEEIRIDRLADAFQIDRFRLIRAFRKVLGTTPYRYVIFRRIEVAKSLLSEGARIADVAQVCGFSDQSHFGRHFLSFVGMTPGQWQRAEYAACDCELGVAG